MKRYILFIVLIILISTGSASARKWNGHNWNQIKSELENAQSAGNEWEALYFDSIRTNYIRGLLDAAYYLNKDNMNSYWPDTDLKTIFTELDEFYTEKRNLRIPVIRALHILGKRHLKETEPEKRF